MYLVCNKNMIFSSLLLMAIVIGNEGTLKTHPYFPFVYIHSITLICSTNDEVLDRLGIHISA